MLACFFSPLLSSAKPLLLCYPSPPAPPPHPPSYLLPLLIFISADALDCVAQHRAEWPGSRLAEGGKNNLIKHVGERSACGPRHGPPLSLCRAAGSGNSESSHFLRRLGEGPPTPSKQRGRVTGRFDQEIQDGFFHVHVDWVFCESTRIVRNLIYYYWHGYHFLYAYLCNLSFSCDLD